MPKEAEALQYALSIDYRSLLVSIVALMAAFVGIYILIKKIQDVLGIETKFTKERKLTQKNIQLLQDDINELKAYKELDAQRTAEFNDALMQLKEEMMSSINKLNRTIAKKDIEDMRWTILDFSNAIRNGRKYDIEAYTHIIDIHDEYLELLKENKMENGRVTLAMNLINEKYEIGMRDGFPV